MNVYSFVSNDKAKQKIRVAVLLTNPLKIPSSHKSKDVRSKYEAKERWHEFSKKCTLVPIVGIWMAESCRGGRRESKKWSERAWISYWNFILKLAIILDNRAESSFPFSKHLPDVTAQLDMTYLRPTQLFAGGLYCDFMQLCDVGKNSP